MSTLPETDTDPAGDLPHRAKEAPANYVALTDTANAVSIMVERIVRRFDPVRIILFGSHARGDAQADSDIDLLIVFSHVTNKRSKAVEIRQALVDLPVAKDIIVTTPDEIARRGDLVGDVLRPALTEGKILYERS
jgi:predicted nucleotidyltransferase